MTAEPSSLETFVRAHSRSLFGTAYLLTGDAAAAEDLVQDTWVWLVTGGRQALQQAGQSGGDPVAVGGKRGLWSPWSADTPSLAVQWAPKLWLVVQGRGLSLPAAERIARSARVTPHLDDPNRWFDANDTFH